MSGIQIILVLLVGGMAGIESVLENSQFERPLIVCTLLGLILGDVKSGIILGGTLEMMSLGWMNIGAALPPDVALAGVISTILVIVGKQSIASGIGVAIPIAMTGQILNTFIRTIAVYFIHKADKYAEQGNWRGIEICHIIPMLLHAPSAASNGRNVPRKTGSPTPASGPIRPILTALTAPSSISPPKAIFSSSAIFTPRIGFAIN